MEDQDYILFDQYLTGELSAEEVIVFEKKLKSDSIFASQFSLYNEVHSHLQSSIENEAENNAFVENLNAISENYFSSTTGEKEQQTDTEQKTRTFTLIKYAMAACVAFLVGVFTFNQFSMPTYGDYNKHEQMTVVRGDASVKDLIAATKAFNSGDYEKAQELLKTVLNNDPENNELKLYYAITNIELDSFEEADKYLTEITNGDSAYKDRALWYSALSKLKQKENEASIAFLKQINEDADDYKEAQKLLDKLE